MQIIIEIFHSHMATTIIIEKDEDEDEGEDVNGNEK